MLSKIFRISLLLPAIYWIYLMVSGNLGADPAKSLNHKTGEMALYYFLLNLLIGISLSISYKFPSILRFLPQNRRYLGVVNFIYLIFHLLLYLTMENFEKRAFTQMLTKTYLIFASLAWLILFSLALSSNNFSVRTMGAKKWKNLHRLIYLAAVFITLHVLLIEKTDLIKYGACFVVLWSLQMIRLIKNLTQTKAHSTS